MAPTLFGLGAVATLLSLLGIAWAAEADGPRAFPHAGARGHAAAAAGSLALLFLLLTASLRLPGVAEFDHLMGRRCYHWGGPAFVAAMQAMTEIGSYRYMLVWLPLVGVGLWWAGRARSIRYFGSVMLGTVGMENLSKEMVRRTRPPTAHGLTTFSFPSSHALAATILAGALLAILLPGCRSRGARLRLTTALSAWPLVIAVSRVDLGAHYVTDVLGGLLLGAAWVCFCRSLYAAWLRRRLAR